jgi:hypothetical protein
MGRAYSKDGGEAEYIKILMGKLGGKRPRRRWVDNIKIDLREIGWYGLD